MSIDIFQFIVEMDIKIFFVNWFVVVGVWVENVGVSIEVFVYMIFVVEFYYVVKLVVEYFKNFFVCFCFQFCFVFFSQVFIIISLFFQGICVVIKGFVFQVVGLVLVQCFFVVGIFVFIVI